MRFELAEMVAVADTQEVLRVLELHLRTVAAEVVRSHGQITAYGIGPSPRTVNRRDTTVVEALSVDGSTQLIANVNYQASALLGNSPQDDIVRAKIKSAINDMRAELNVASPWSEPTKDTEEQSELDRMFAMTAAGVESERFAEEEMIPPPFAEQAVLSFTVEAPVSSMNGSSWIHAEPEAVVAPEAVEPGIPEQRVIAQAPHRELKIYQGPAERRTGPQRAIKRGAEANDAIRIERRRIAPLDEVPMRGLLRTQGVELPAGRGRSKIVLAAVGSVLLVTGVAGYTLRDLLPTPESWRTTIAVWSKEMIEAVPLLGRAHRKVSAAVSAPVAEPAPEKVVEVASSIVDDPTVMVKRESNIYAWVQDWAAALRSSDPIAQASYYADRVDKYQARAKVSREQVMLDKTARIGRRGPVWTIKIDHVNIESQSAGAMQLRVVKHLLSRNSKGEPIATLVKTRLKLIRVGGTWKIREERDVS